MNIERRIACVAEEIRVETENDEIRLTGLAVAYNSLSEDLGGFRERVLPGVFKATLETNSEVKALVGHDSTKVIGSRHAKTLILRDGDDGLRVSIKLPRTTYAADLAESVRRGDQGKMSFGFAVRSDNWHKENGDVIRDLVAADLYEVSAVAWPAYQQTSIDVAKRSMQQWMEQESEAVSWLPGPDLLRRRLSLKKRAG